MNQQQIRFTVRMIATGCALLGLIATNSVQADTLGDRPVTKRQVFGRRITITRRGYGQARTNSATIELPFALEGENWDAVEKQRILLLDSLRKEIAPYLSSANAVSIDNSQSGQTYRDDKKITTDSGTVSVSVGDLTHLKEILILLGKREPGPSTVRFWASGTALLLKAQKQAQGNAVALARQAADRWAGMAGTRIIGVLEIWEGVMQGELPTREPVLKHADNPIPHEVSVVSAEVTITFELAPPDSDKPASKTKRKSSKILGY